MAERPAIDRAEWQALVKKANTHRFVSHTTARADLGVQMSLQPSSDAAGRAVE